jgi:hypothetical protein
VEDTDETDGRKNCQRMKRIENEWQNGSVWFPFPFGPFVSIRVIRWQIPPYGLFHPCPPQAKLLVFDQRKSLPAEDTDETDADTVRRSWANE